MQALNTASGKLVSIITPFYNEEAGVSVFIEEINKLFLQLPQIFFEVILIDDGSTDDTLNNLISITEKDQRFRVIEFSRNFGKEAALSAGIDFARGEAVIPIDSDLQDPPELIIDMIHKWDAGAEVVLARRANRKSDTILKRGTAALFYRLNNMVSNVSIPENVGDYRLMDRVVIDSLKMLPEKQRFMKGLFAWVGFKTVYLDYSRRPRMTGDSKFSGWKLWNFALDGITSFSTIPLRFWTYLGLIVAIIDFIYALTIVIRTAFLGIQVPGYASLIVVTLFMGGMQLIGIGILGEYLGRLFIEAKNRPVYIIRKIHGVKF
jgi:polyisoprenyl-phosphate glycosyltransferase